MLPVTAKLRSLDSPLRLGRLSRRSLLYAGSLALRPSALSSACEFFIESAYTKRLKALACLENISTRHQIEAYSMSSRLLGALWRFQRARGTTSYNLPLDPTFHSQSMIVSRDCLGARLCYRQCFGVDTTDIWTMEHSAARFAGGANWESQNSMKSDLSVRLEGV